MWLGCFRVFKKNSEVVCVIVFNLYFFRMLSIFNDRLKNIVFFEVDI